MIQCDADRLTDALMELEPKRRARAVKSAFYRAAAKLRKKAIEHLRQERRAIASKTYSNGRKKTKSHQPGPNPNAALEKGMKSMVYRKTPGFRVTVGSKYGNKNGKGKRGLYTNRRGLEKPVLMWMEGGSKSRSTKTKGGLFKKTKKGHVTGRMPAMGFMDKAKAEMTPRITEDLHEAMEKSIMQALKKYGKP